MDRGGKPLETSGTVNPGLPVFLESDPFVRLDFGSHAWVGEPADSGWRLNVEGQENSTEPRWIDVSDTGWTLRQGDRVEAWTFRGDMEGRGAGGWVLMLENGRLFRTVQTRLVAPRIELVDWESGAPYWIAGPEANRWKLTPTAAGSGLAMKETLLAPWALTIVQADIRR